MPIVVPSSASVLTKSLVELGCLTILSGPMLYVHLIASNYGPFERGYFCDDQSIKHPYTEEQTVPMEICFVVWFLINTILIVLVEALSWTIKPMRSERIMIGSYCIFGAIGTNVFVDLSKFSIGRLRPHFLSICQPVMNDEHCKEGDFMKFVVPEDGDLASVTCPGIDQDLPGGTTITEKMIREARLSFMSGHSAFSFYCATYIIIYLQLRLDSLPDSNNKKMNIVRSLVKAVRPFLQIGIFSLAFWIALTRVSDYFHHPLDVLTGSLVGILIGIVITYITGMSRKEFAFWKNNVKSTNSKTNFRQTNSFDLPRTNKDKKTIDDFIKKFEN